jgi:hypothetical protein
LFRYLVGVGRSALGFKDTVQAVDIAVFSSVGIPIKFFEGKITMELGEEPLPNL